jgi:hypothetical protein
MQINQWDPWEDFKERELPNEDVINEIFNKIDENKTKNNK